METVEFIAKYLILPLISIICTVVWRMYKKLDTRMDKLENRATNNEKEIIEIRTELRKDIQYMAEDVKEIKELLKSKK
jgi:uncharacterized coiled-coil protein SlyX